MALSLLHSFQVKRISVDDNIQMWVNGFEGAWPQVEAFAKAAAETDSISNIPRDYYRQFLSLRDRVAALEQVSGYRAEQDTPGSTPLQNPGVDSPDPLPGAKRRRK